MSINMLFEHHASVGRRPYFFFHRYRLELATRRGHNSVARGLCLSKEDLEHEGYTLEAEHIISDIILAIFGIMTLATHRLAGISILSCGGSRSPFVDGASDAEV